MKKYVCLKVGCYYHSESPADADAHQKMGQDHNIEIIELDPYQKGKIVREQIQTDPE